MSQTTKTYLQLHHEEVKKMFDKMSAEGQEMILAGHKSAYTVRFSEEQRVLMERALTMLHALEPRPETSDLLSMCNSLPIDNADSTPWHPLTHGWAL